MQNIPSQGDVPLLSEAPKPSISIDNTNLSQSVRHFLMENAAATVTVNYSNNYLFNSLTGLFRLVNCKSNFHCWCWCLLESIISAMEGRTPAPSKKGSLYIDFIPTSRDSTPRKLPCIQASIYQQKRPEAKSKHTQSVSLLSSGHPVQPLERSAYINTELIAVAY